MKTIARLLSLQMVEDPSLRGVFVSRVEFNADKSVCSVFFYTEEGEEFFAEKLERLKLYRPSLRKALAQEIEGRYVPEIVFRFDAQMKKQLAIEHLLDTIKE